MRRLIGLLTAISVFSLSFQHEAQAEAQAQAAAPVQATTSAAAIASIAAKPMIEFGPKGSVTANPAPATPQLPLSLQILNSVVQALIVMMAVEGANYGSEILRQRQLNPTRDNISLVAKEAAHKFTENYHLWYQSGERTINTIVGFSIGSKLGPLLEKHIALPIFSGFLASAITSILIICGLDFGSQLTQYSANLVYDRALELRLTSRQIELVQKMGEPDKFSYISFLKSLNLNDDADSKIVHQIVWKAMFTALLHEGEFNRAFFSYWTRSRFNGDNVVRIAAIFANVVTWSYITGTLGGAAGTVAQPGAGTAIGFWTGVAFGLPLSIGFGVATARVPQITRDNITSNLQTGYVSLINTSANWAQKVISLGRTFLGSNSQQITVENVEREMRVRRSNRESLTLHTMDLLKLGLDRMDVVRGDLAVFRAQRNTRMQEDPKKYYQEELGKVFTESWKSFFFLPSSKSLETLISQNEYLFRTYKGGFSDLAHTLVHAYQDDINAFKQYRRQYYYPKLQSTLNAHINQLTQLRDFYRTLLTHVKAGQVEDHLTSNFINARKTIERIGFWKINEDRLRDEIQRISRFTAPKVVEKEALENAISHIHLTIGD